MPFILLFVVIIGLLVGLMLIAALAYFSTKGTLHLARALRQPVLPRSVRNSLDESRRYGRQMLATARQYPAGPIRDRLDLTLRPVDEWLARLAKLEQGLAKLYGQHNLKRELRRTRFELDELRRQVRTAADQEAASLAELLRSKENFYAALRELELFQTQAELKIHKIASDLGAAHAEMLLITTRGDFNDNRLRRLDENLQEHVSSLRDLLAAMEEMGYRSAVS